MTGNMLTFYTEPIGHETNLSTPYDVVSYVSDSCRVTTILLDT